MMQMHFNGRNLRNPVARLVIGALAVAVAALILLLILSVAGVALVVGGVLILGLGIRRFLLGGGWKRKKREVIEEAEVLESTQKTTHGTEPRRLNIGSQD